jgi:hypothetical protein
MSGPRSGDDMTPTIQSVEDLARSSIARHCQYVIAAILVLMVFLSWNLGLACEVGGALCLILCAILLWAAYLATRRPIERTTLWFLLDERPRVEIGQRVFGRVLRDCYLEAAGIIARLAVLILLVGLAFSFTG